VFYTTQYMLCFIRHSIGCVLYDTVYVVFYTTQYMLCFIRHITLSIYFVPLGAIAPSGLWLSMYISNNLKYN